MKQVGGIWLPDGETHMVGWMQNRGQMVDGKLTYQYSKLEASLALCKQFRGAVDIGAHAGTWSMHLAKRFDVLHAFEPVPEHRDCWERNMEGRGGLLYGFALGEREGSVHMQVNPSSTGDSRILGDGLVPMRRLDDFALGDIDFIKLDCEGYELFTLRGAENTLIRNRPAICVEQKPGRAERYGIGRTDAVTYLEGLGAKLRRVISGDYLMSWD